MNDATAPSLLSDGGGVREDAYAISLDMFEGPLDLLLHLVRRHELDVLDIPIAFVTEKYIQYLDFARALDIEIAGDYLVMAATLAYLKSRELLPRDDELEGGEGEEGPDPREELVRRLIEYERFRYASNELYGRPLRGRDVFTRGGEIDVPRLDPELAPVTLFRLAEAYGRVLDRANVAKDHEVLLERITVRQRIEQLGLILIEQDEVEFEGLFLSRSWSSEDELRNVLVVTLMSLLEMVKLGLIGVHQATGSESLMLRRRAVPERMREVVAEYREDDELADAEEPEIVTGGSTP